MSDIKRSDLRAWPKPRTDHRPVTDDEFVRLASEWAAENPAAALDAALKEECPRCEGNSPTQAESISAAGEIVQEWCHACDGGRRWKPGVLQNRSFDAAGVSWIAMVEFPAEMMEDDA